MQRAVLQGDHLPEGFGNAARHFEQALRHGLLGEEEEEEPHEGVRLDITAIRGEGRGGGGDGGRRQARNRAPFSERNLGSTGVPESAE